MAVDILGRVIEEASGKRLSRLLGRTTVPAAQNGRLGLLGAPVEDLAPRAAAPVDPLQA